MDKGALISDDEFYRYKLWRIWDESLPCVLFIGLNPSTADANIDDPTIRKCIALTKNWGYGGFYMGNLFGFRSTKPENLISASDPIGKCNDTALNEMAQKAEIIVAAWGNKGRLFNRDKEIIRQFPQLHCLKITKENQPIHPLYQRNDANLLNYRT